MEVEIAYVVMAGDNWCAESNDLTEAVHYLREYRLDGPADLYEVIRLSRKLSVNP